MSHLHFVGGHPGAALFPAVAESERAHSEAVTFQASAYETDWHLIGQRRSHGQAQTQKVVKYILSMDVAEEEVTTFEWQPNVYRETLIWYISRVMEVIMQRRSRAVDPCIMKSQMSSLSFILEGTASHYNPSTVCINNFLSIDF